MDFIDEIKGLSARIPKQLAHIQTEEATKSALIMPFINALGYNVFDPTEVVPEFTADVGTKKGEKVDYAIFQDGKAIMLFECKWRGANLDTEHASQLFRYFTVTEARIGVLTNGIVYRFYSDLESPNKMDSKPFLVFDMLNIDDTLVPELKKLTKGAFNVDLVISSAGELKYTREIRRILGEQLASPDEDFVQYFLSKVYSGRKTQAVKEQFSGIVRQAFRAFINDRINETLKTALSGSNAEPSVTKTASTSEQNEVPEDPIEEGIVTTAEELEAYYIVKAILRDTVAPTRIYARDALSYMSILLDDNNRKPICRLHFNSSKKKHIIIFGPNKTQEKVLIQTNDDIYQHAEKLKAVAVWYDNQK